MRFSALFLLIPLFSGCVTETPLEEPLAISHAIYEVSNSNETLDISWKLEGDYFHVSLTHGGSEAMQIIDGNGRVIEQRSNKHPNYWGMIRYPHGAEAYAPRAVLFVPETTVHLTDSTLAHMNLFGLALAQTNDELTVSNDGNESIISYECMRDCGYLNGDVLQPRFAVSLGPFFPEKIQFPNNELTLTLLEAGIPLMSEAAVFPGWPTPDASCSTFCKEGDWRTGLDLQQAYEVLTSTDPLHVDSQTVFLLASANDEGSGSWYHFIQDGAQKFNQQAQLVGVNGESTPVVLPPAASAADLVPGERGPRVPFDTPWNSANLDGVLTSVASLNVVERQNPDHSFSQRYRYNFDNEHGAFGYHVAEQTGWPLLVVQHSNLLG